MPTKRAVFLILMGGVCLLAAWFSELGWFYLGFSAIFGILVVSFILSRLLILNLQIQRQIQKCAYEDDTIDVCLKISSKLSLFNQSLEIIEHFSPEQPGRQQKIINILGALSGKMQFSYQGNCYKRGYYKIGPMLIKMYDSFGLFCVKENINVYSELIVYPQVFLVNRLPFILGPLAPRYGEQTTRISGNYEEFYGIREYQKEDGWRRIHWRSSARLGQLMVRHFEQSSQWKSVMILDAQAGSNIGYGRKTTFEYAIKIIASIMRHLLYKGASYGFMASNAQNFNISINKGKSQYYKALDKLAIIDADGKSSLAQFIARFQWMIPPSCSLIILTNKFDKQLVDFLHNLKLQRNIGVIPVILNAESFLTNYNPKNKQNKISAIKEFLQRISFESYLIDCTDNLRSYFL